MKNYLPLSLSLLLASCSNLWCMDLKMREELVIPPLAAGSTARPALGSTEGGLSSSLSQRALDFKKKLVNYMESEYEKEISERLKDVKEFLIKRALQARQANTNKRLAIVLDIDESSLSNWLSLLTFTDWESTASGNCHPLIAHIEIHRATAKARAISLVLEIYTLARELDIEVFFISGRPAVQNPQTLATLEEAGYKSVKPENLICKTSEEMKEPRTPNKEWKPIKRQDIIDGKYNNTEYIIILNIGDQESDLNTGPNGEGAFERGVKLPNPLYEC